MICDLLESHFFFNLVRSDEKKSWAKNKIIFFFKFFSCKIIFYLWKKPFNNNIFILERKMIYFCPRSNFCGWTTLSIFFKARNAKIILRMSLIFQIAVSNLLKQVLDLWDLAKVLWEAQEVNNSSEWRSHDWCKGDRDEEEGITGVGDRN